MRDLINKTGGKKDDKAGDKAKALEKEVADYRMTVNNMKRREDGYTRDIRQKDNEVKDLGRKLERETAEVKKLKDLAKSRQRSVKRLESEGSRVSRGRQSTTDDGYADAASDASAASSAAERRPRRGSGRAAAAEERMRSSSREREAAEQQQRADELRWAEMALAMEQAEGLDSGGSLAEDSDDDFAAEDAYMARKAAAR